MTCNEIFQMHRILANPTNPRDVNKALGIRISVESFRIRTAARTMETRVVPDRDIALNTRSSQSPSGRLHNILEPIGMQYRAYSNSHIRHIRISAEPFRIGSAA